MYHSLQLAANKRFSHGLMFQAVLHTEPTGERHGERRTVFP